MGMQSRKVLVLNVTSTSGFGSAATPTPYRMIGLTGDLAGNEAHCWGACEQGVVSAGDVIPVIHLGTATVEITGNVAVNGELEVSSNGILQAWTDGVLVARLAPGEAAITTGSGFREVVLIPN